MTRFFILNISWVNNVPIVFRLNFFVLLYFFSECDARPYRCVFLRVERDFQVPLSSLFTLLHLCTQTPEKFDIYFWIFMTQKRGEKEENWRDVEGI